MHPNDGRVVSNFIVQALKGEPVTLFGDGTQTRSFCYVDDLIESPRVLRRLQRLRRWSYEQTNWSVPGFKDALSRCFLELEVL